MSADCMPWGADPELKELFVPQRNQQGDWTKVTSCPGGHFAVGLRARVEKPVGVAGWKDDTGKYWVWGVYTHIYTHSHCCWLV